MKHVGFTGTRSGMTPGQKSTVCRLIQQMATFIFHHGDCVGADAEAHDLVRHTNSHIVIHPPNKDDFRAFRKGDEERPIKSYFARNRDIVNESDVVIATPYTAGETGGGTWYTINYCKKYKKKVYIVNPNGDISYD
jgi:hypothetical protein